MTTDSHGDVDNELMGSSLLQRLYPEMTMAELEDEFARQLLRLSEHPDSAEAMS